jgi:hypothetical protein
LADLKKKKTDIYPIDFRRKRNKCAGLEIAQTKTTLRQRRQHIDRPQDPRSGDTIPFFYSRASRRSSIDSAAGKSTQKLNLQEQSSGPHHAQLTNL